MRTGFTQKSLQDNKNLSSLSLVRRREILTSKQQNRKGTVTSARASKTSGTSIRREIRRELARVIETKVTHVNMVPASVSYSGTIHNLCYALSKGDTAFTFTGNLVKPKSLRIRGLVNTDQPYNGFRLMVFRWKDSSFPVPSGILDASTSTFAPYSFLYWANVHKIDVLYDELVALKVRNNVGDDAHSFDIKINFGDNVPVIQMPDSTGPNLTPQMNGLYMLVISDDALPNQPEFVGRSELQFTDA